MEDTRFYILIYTIIFVFTIIFVSIIWSLNAYTPHYDGLFKNLSIRCRYTNFSACIQTGLLLQIFPLMIVHIFPSYKSRIIYAIFNNLGFALIVSFTYATLNNCIYEIQKQPLFLTVEQKQNYHKISWYTYVTTTLTKIYAINVPICFFISVIKIFLIQDLFYETLLTTELWLKTIFSFIILFRIICSILQEDNYNHSLIKIIHSITYIRSTLILLSVFIALPNEYADMDTKIVHYISEPLVYFIFSIHTMKNLYYFDIITTPPKDD